MLKKLKTMSEETIDSIFAAQEVPATEEVAENVETSTPEVETVETTEEESAVESVAPSTEGKIFTQNGITYKRVMVNGSLVDVRI